MQVISYHNYSVSRALVDLFPEISLSLEKFKIDKSLVLEKSILIHLPPSRTLIFISAPWYYVENRKNFFLNYAKENEFNPLVPEHWYAMSRMRIKSQKVLICYIF
jgi:hypothetical protein